MKNNYIFNTIVVHVSRTWERIRLNEPFAEMTYDNIESVDEIISISEVILQDEGIQKFINTKDKRDFFNRELDTFSDTYIEKIAYSLITKLIES